MLSFKLAREARRFFEKYTKNVFKETLRLWPVIPSINRITTEEINIDNIRIPKNTEIAVTYRKKLFDIQQIFQQQK